ncbi:hypothetical protein OJAV_G00211440 [Oryzias javanicus]|uniref:Uncharacterized protein n=1 Tax=Oryzias javanicus TaxID=123683 RepID=A0A3S2PNZ2_ORYJA|nr:hypothetical protein OJAV_G00211440 [Oryzias javanicus]
MLFHKKVKFLGHEVSSDGVSPDPEKTAAVQSWDPPATVKQTAKLGAVEQRLQIASTDPECGGDQLVQAMDVPNETGEPFEGWGWNPTLWRFEQEKDPTVCQNPCGHANGSSDRDEYH